MGKEGEMTSGWNETWVPSATVWCLSRVRHSQSRCWHFYFLVNVFGYIIHLYMYVYMRVYMYILAFMLIKGFAGTFLLVRHGF